MRLGKEQAAGYVEDNEAQGTAEVRLPPVPEREIQERDKAAAATDRE